MLTYTLMLASPASGSTHPSSRLPSTFDDCSHLSSALLCLLLCSASFCSLRNLPSLVLFQSRGKSRAQALCVGFTPKQTKGSFDLHPRQHTQRNKCHPSCHVSAQSPEFKSLTSMFAFQRLLSHHLQVNSRTDQTL